MKKTSILLLSLLLFLISLGQLIFTDSTFAAETQTVYLHKQAGGALTEADVEEQQNMLTEKKGVNGVEFTLVDITQYIRKSDSFDTALEKAKTVTKTDLSGLAIGQAVSKYPGMTIVTKGTTQRQPIPDKNGQLTEMDGTLKLVLAKKNAEYDASYLIVETQSVDTCNPSSNLIFHFPVENNQDLHLYSKNDSLLELPGLSKSLLEEHNDFSYEEAIHYKITVQIPTLINSYQYFQIVDLPDENLTVDVSSIQLQVKNDSVDPSWYQIEAKDNGFQVNFEPSKVSSIGGQTVTVYYQLKINKHAEPDIDFFNTAYLKYHNGQQEMVQESISEAVRTGGYRFIKVDSADRKKVLSNATFIIRNVSGAYLTKDYFWKNTDVQTDQELFKITSNTQGTFNIKGLAYGDYQLVEIVAPEGYRRSNQPINFSVARNTYAAGDNSIALLEVLNSRLPNTGTPVTGGGTPNIVTRWLPKTGEIKSIGGVVLGSFILLGVFVAIRYKKKLNENEGEIEK